ncbi:MAG: hypothetical protein RLZZ324_752, partial [Candidatus Parcubacteria bacterium]
MEPEKKTRKLRRVRDNSDKPEIKLTEEDLHEVPDMTEEAVMELEDADLEEVPDLTKDAVALTPPKFDADQADLHTLVRKAKAEHPTVAKKEAVSGDDKVAIEQDFETKQRVRRAEDIELLKDVEFVQKVNEERKAAAAFEKEISLGSLVKRTKAELAKKDEAVRAAGIAAAKEQLTRPEKTKALPDTIEIPKGFARDEELTTVIKAEGPRPSSSEHPRHMDTLRNEDELYNQFMEEGDRISTENELKQQMPEETESLALAGPAETAKAKARLGELETYIGRLESGPGGVKSIENVLRNTYGYEPERMKSGFMARTLDMGRRLIQPSFRKLRKEYAMKLNRLDALSQERDDLVMLIEDPAAWKERQQTMAERSLRTQKPEPKAPQFGELRH